MKANLTININDNDLKRHGYKGVDIIRSFIRFYNIDNCSINDVNIKFEDNIKKITLKK